MAKKIEGARHKAPGAKKPTPTAKHRQIRPPKYKSFRISKRIRSPKTPLKGSFKLFAFSLRVLIQHWRLFGGIVLIYLLLTIILVRGLGSTNNIADLKSTVQALFHGNTAGLYTGLTLFSVLLGNISSTSSDVGGAYQSIFLIVMSLVLIWALRHSLASKKTKIQLREAFYRGPGPVVPFLLILMVIGLQLLPIIIANFLYRAVIIGGVAITNLEKGLWIIFIILLIVLSFYMLTSSLFALYIVTLPDVRPMQALRSARELVRYRRWVIMRKVLFLPIALLVLAAAITVPVIMLSPTIAEWLFFVLSVSALAVGHSYFYNLYRELL